MASKTMAMDELLGAEGGYVNNPADPGGETKWGISKRSYPQIDIAGLTREAAVEIYERDFWLPSGCSRIEDQELAEEVLKAVVNCGVSVGVKRLQVSLNDLVGFKALVEDGKFGEATASLLVIEEALGFAKLLRRTFELEMVKYYAGLKNFSTFGRGWVNRVLLS